MRDGVDLVLQRLQKETLSGTSAILARTAWGAYATATRGESSRKSPICYRRAAPEVGRATLFLRAVRLRPVARFAVVFLGAAFFLDAFLDAALVDPGFRPRLGVRAGANSSSRCAGQ